MEWTIRWWQVSIKRVYPTSAQLSQAYNRSASWWHQHLHFFGYNQAYIELWRSLLSLSGMFFPAVLLLALPWLLALSSDRVFSYAMLYRAMSDVMIWLSSCALLDVINGTLFLLTTQEREQN
jgi:hypothetical protein